MAEAHVLKLIINGNKPISLQNVIDLSQTQGFKKAQCQKAVDSLSESGKITTKVRVIGAFRVVTDNLSSSV